MTNQRLFDRVSKHLLKQGKKSIDPNGMCLYRDPRGLKCAIGCLIPDSRYYPGLEGKSIYTSAVMAAARYTKDQIKLVLELQNLHDAFIINSDCWPEKLAEIARNNGLTFAYSREKQHAEAE